MRHIALYYDASSSRGRSVINTLMAGIAQADLGDKVAIYTEQEYKKGIHGDIVCWYGLSGKLMDLAHLLWESKTPNVFFDLPYWGRKHEPHPQHHRFALNAHQPTKYFQQGREPERFLAFNRPIKPWRETSQAGAVLVAGMSDKQTQAWGLGPSWEFHVELIEKFKRQWGDWVGKDPPPIAWRPKPACRVSRRPIPGTRYADGLLSEELQRSLLVYTYRSNTAIDGLIEGVPCEVVGSDHPAYVLSCKDPISQDVRLQFCADLAYCQTSMQELRNGRAWKFISNQLGELP